MSVQYSVCDVILLGQIYYYRWKKGRVSVAPLVPDVSIPPGTASENTPLLTTGDAIGTERKRPSLATQFIKYGATVLFVLLTGAAAWAIDQHLHKGQPRTSPKEVVEWKSQVLGWISAVMFRAYAFVVQCADSGADSKRSRCSCSSDT